MNDKKTILYNFILSFCVSDPSSFISINIYLVNVVKRFIHNIFHQICLHLFQAWKSNPTFSILPNLIQ